MKSLTDKQIAVLCFIEDYINEQGYSPSLTDIARCYGSIFRHSAWRICLDLRAAGLLDWAECKVRTIHLTQKGRQRLHGREEIEDALDPGTSQ